MRIDEWKQYAQQQLEAKKNRSDTLLKDALRTITASAIVGLIVCVIIFVGWGGKELVRMMLQGIITITMAGLITGWLVRHVEKIQKL